MTLHPLAGCACLHVDYDPLHNEDGTYSERWQCRYCKTAFVKRVWYEQARASIAELRHEIEAWESGAIAPKLYRDMNAQLNGVLEERDRLHEQLSNLADAMKLFEVTVENFTSLLVQVKDNDALRARLAAVVKTLEAKAQGYRDNKTTWACKYIADELDKAAAIARSKR